MAKPVLIATDVIAAAGRGDQKAVEALQQAEWDASPAVSVLTEISLSARYEDDEQIDRLLSFLSRFVILPMDLKISRKSIELRRRYSLNPANSLMAATAIVRGRALITADPDTFRPVEELSLESSPLHAE